jgi:hypothetical protein
LIESFHGVHRGAAASAGGLTRAGRSFRGFRHAMHRLIFALLVASRNRVFGINGAENRVKNVI